jgi:hypothetical protein
MIYPGLEREVLEDRDVNCVILARGGDLEEEIGIEF